MNLVYINNGRSSVFDSQVLALLQYYKSENFFDEVILLFGYRNQEEKIWMQNKKLGHIKLFFFKSYPNYPIFNSLIACNIYKSVSEIQSEYPDIIFHIRGEMTSYHFKKVLGKLNIDTSRLLTDVRGVSWEEVNEFMAINPVLKKLKLRNLNKANHALMHDKSISVVSPALKDYLIEKWNIGGNSIYVTSCLVSENFKFSQTKRNKIRKELGLKEDEILIVFSSGGAAKWQENDMIVDIANKGLKVLNLSRTEYLHKNIINRFVPYIEVPAYLSAADTAFIWRSESIVNRVASPVKFSEYMAVGLPIIHNGTVDLINSITEKHGNGILINNVSDLHQEILLKTIEKTDRLKVSEIGKSLFDVSSIAKLYLKIYQSNDN